MYLSALFDSNRRLALYREKRQLASSSKPPAGWDLCKKPVPVSFNDPLWTLHYEIMMYGLTLVFGLAGALNDKARFCLCVLFVMAAGIAAYGIQSPWFQGALFLRLMPFYVAGMTVWVFRMYIPVSAGIFIGLAAMTTAAYWSDLF